MKTIKIFLASSDELEVDRARFGNLIRRLERIYEKRGIRLELIEWEDLDAAWNGIRKQDEYNREIRTSDMFLAVFHRKAGKFTIEEFNVALDEYKAHSAPKIYTYVKDLAPDESETPELVEFKKTLYDELGHYWVRYGNTDTMQLHFVLQLQYVEGANPNSSGIEIENSKVKLDGLTVADLNEVPFAANNRQYIEYKQRIETIQNMIATFEGMLAAGPNEQIETMLGQQRTELYNLRKRMAELEASLLSTAATIVAVQGKATSERLRRATQLFESGDNKGADAVLDFKEIEADAQRNLQNYRLSLQMAEEAKKAIVSNIEEYRVKAKNLLSLYDNEQRFAEAERCYKEALRLAKDAEVDPETLIVILGDYGNFCRDVAKYRDAISVYEEMLSILKEHPNLDCNWRIDICLNNIGVVYDGLGEYDKALEWYFKSLDIMERVLGKDHPDTAMTYGNIGAAYDGLDEYDKALEWHFKSLDIMERVLGKDHPDTAISYNNIGNAYYSLGEYDKALEWHFKALDIRERILGKDHPDTARTYNGIGSVYYSLEEYEKALEWHSKALDIRERILGKDHPDTAISYNNIGVAYGSLEEYDKALECFSKALGIQERILGKDHPDTAASYNNIGYIYDSLEEYDKALEWYAKALDIRERILGKNHPATATTYSNIGAVYDYLEEYDKALEWFFKALDIEERILGKNHPATATTYSNIGAVYDSLEEYDKALEWFFKALDIEEEILGKEHHDTVDTYNHIASVYKNSGDFAESLKWYHKIIKIVPKDEDIWSDIAFAYNEIGEHEKAIEAATQAIAVAPEYPHPYRHLAIAYEAKGYMEKAVANYLKSANLGDEKAKEWLRESHHSPIARSSPGQHPTRIIIGLSIIFLITFLVFYILLH